MFWNGTRWVEDRPLDQGQGTTPPRPRHRRRRLLATIAVVMLAPALLVPFWPVNAAGPRLTVGSNAVRGGSLSVSGDGFTAHVWVQLRWDGSAVGMPTVRTSGQGTFATSVGIPMNAAPGSHQLAAGESSSGGRSAASGTSTTIVATATVVVVDPTATPAPVMSGPATGTGTPEPTLGVAPATSPTPGPTPTPIETPTVAPSAIARATSAPVLNPTAAPTSSAIPSAGPTAASCGLLQDRIDATAAGSTLDLTGCTFTIGATIGKPLTLVGATIHVPAAQRGLLVASSGVTLDHLTILGSQSTSYNASETGIYANGTAASPIVNLTIRSSNIGKFGQSALWLRHVSNVTVANNQIHDTVYAGIMILSGQGGAISRNFVQRVGVAGSGANGGNAYGIALSDTEAPATSSIVVDGNTVTDVPTWHALDTHGGRNVSFTNNTVLRSSRGVFITRDGIGNRATTVLVQGNLLGSPSPVTYNLCAVTTYDTDDVTITGNSWSSGWGGDYFGDYNSLSTNLVVSNNTVS